MRQAPSPWETSEADFPADASPADKLRFLVNYAVLAPSGHNTQPWLFQITGDSLELMADRARGLSVVDPDGRELTISCGAALEMLCIAMRHYGYQPTVSVLPVSDDPDLLASVRLGEGGTTDDNGKGLFHAITKRRTVRQRFENKPVPPALMAEIGRLAWLYGVGLRTIIDSGTRREIAELVAEGDRRQFMDRDFRRELASWIHSRRAAMHDGISGEGLGMPDALSSLGAAVVRRFNIGGIAAVRDKKNIAGSPALGLFYTATDTVEEWLATGRALALVLLACTAQDVRASFLSQPIEVPELRTGLARVANVRGIPQLLLRFGYGPLIARSARRPVKEVLL